MFFNKIILTENYFPCVRISIRKYIQLYNKGATTDNVLMDLNVTLEMKALLSIQMMACTAPFRTWSVLMVYRIMVGQY